jgi:hypothetical protein
MNYINNITNSISKIYLPYVSENIIDSHMIINIIMNSGLIASFIAVFFFTYATTIEEDIVKNQTVIVINDLMQTINPLLPDDVKKQMYNNIKASDMSDVDTNASNINNKIINDAYSSLIIIFSIALLIVMLISIAYNHNLYEILGLNLILLVLVALTEFTFLHFIPHKFISADTNWVRWKILTTLKSKLLFN